jgi:signal transduction histidine kinase/ActR/RegA family two-component response regulator
VTGDDRSERPWARLLSPGLLVVLLLVSWSTFAVSRRLVQDQERRLLAERSDEVAALLNNAFASLESSLRVLGGVGASADSAATRVFGEAARPMIRGNTSAVGIASARGQRFYVAAMVGDGPATGQPLTADREQVASRAVQANKLAAGLVGVAPRQRRLVLAVPAGTAGTVVYQESVVTPQVPVASTAASPFRELRVALYASAAGDADSLLLTTETDVRLRGEVRRIPFAVGADTWLLVVAAKEPLAGPFARNFPWLLLGGGAVMALLAASVVEVLVRRRRYALSLVAQRTAELERVVGDLAEVRSFLDRLLTAGPVLVARVALPERRISYVSPNIERLFGISEDRALTPGFLGTTVHPDDRAAYAAAYDLIVSGTSAREEVEYRSAPNGDRYAWVSATLVPELGDDGAIVAVLGYVIGIDDRRRADEARREAQEAAETANRSKSEFLSRMSHELRTPLNAVIGFGQLLQLTDLTAGQRESVDHILKGGRHLLSLINEVLDISRIEAGELALSPEAVFATDLIVEAAELMRPLADNHGVRLVFERSGVCDCFVFADRQRTKQVLINLLANAIKYNRAHGTVAITCERTSEATLQILVSDTGHGIAAEHLGLLFTPFERLGAEQTEIEGTGIGLALSRRLAEAMGGRLGARSVLGEGSTFTLELPLVEGPVERYERLRVHTGVTVATQVEGRHRVLHIEDNAANLKLVERIFEQRQSVEVIAALHGRLGLELAREHEPILILLDLHLPDMDGGQVLQRLRDDPVTASIPVVVVSADATPGQVKRLLAAGASAYLTKPIDVTELLGVLDEALEQSARGL